ncbi:FHA domain-containing protein [Corallococcus praedator]|uniref:FHA domain-containing protein n=1 Tax=Corallococcus praedator TaxID=2316724 RepID=A0ABX9QPR6_9BACT|nr:MULTISPECIES: FHA domain-containing protein [Corallococcus]RKH33862.1 FHA domain-containing protein [Corallococcus sp. CA031C]RKI15162.1 FHA domain-containing protein [Corallococcus praedator]
MLKLIIEDDEGRKTVVPFVRDEITIGRQEGNTIRLTERNVSRRHARLVRLNGHVVLEDLGSYNGTRINGERVAGQLPLKEGDLIQIGDYDLALQVEGAAATAAPTGAITAKVPASRRAEPDDEDDAPAPAASQDDEEEDEDGAEDGDEHDHTPPSAEMRRNATSIIRMDQMEADRPRKVERVPDDEQPRLLVLSPTEFKGQEYDCNRTELRIGRTSENDIALDHRSLSRTHAKIVREETGEWRVIDMQSANGMTVNGESYAQATLSHGDVIEMGHVKLRFVGPGTLAEDIAAQSRSGSKKMLVTAVVAFLSIAAGAAIFVVKGEEWFGPPQPPPVVTDNQPPPTNPPDTAPPQQPETVVATPETPPDTKTPEAPKPPAVTRDDFYAALKDGNLQNAAAVLKGLRETAKGPASAKALDGLENDLKRETAADKGLTDTETALNQGNDAEAIRVFAKVSKDTVFASRYSDLGARVDEAKKKAAEEPPPEAPVAAAETDATREKFKVINQQAYDLATARKYDEALKVAQQCPAIAASNPDCALLLGYLYAKVKDFKKSEENYERFLTLAPPDHPRRTRVIDILKVNKAEGAGSPQDKPSAQKTSQ